MVDMRDDRDIADLHCFSLGKVSHTRHAAGAASLAAHIIGFSHVRKGRLPSPLLNHESQIEKIEGNAEPLPRGGVAAPMNGIPAKYTRIVGIVLASAAFLWALAFTAVDARTTVSGNARLVAMLADQHTEDAVAETPAEFMFPGAPDGVDPMTTGPVSAELRERQKALGCADAVWPNVAVACYPN